MRRDHSQPLTGYEKEFDSLELCLACVHVGCKKDQGAGRRKRDEYAELMSFRIVAACALLGELDYYEKVMKASSEFVEMGHGNGNGNGNRNGPELLSTGVARLSLK